MENKKGKLEKQILDLYWYSALRAQPQIDKYGFYAIMPEWGDFEKYMMSKLKDKKVH